ncbi:MAG: hypothetical protein EA421_02270 [Gemmatimonadales bacterium]|nr:MAG: hypothetical protein EA421_02270 [Gemmatimonadales bacterium]
MRGPLPGRSLSGEGETRAPITPGGPLEACSRSQGCFEWEIHRTVQRFGSIAQVMSTYEAATTPDGEPFVRGINSIQLTWDGERWWIVSWIYDEERPDNPIPAEFLPGR